MTRAGIREERLRATAGLRKAPALTSWRGRSGRRYVVGVHALSEPEATEAGEAVLLAVRRSGDGDAALLGATVPGAQTSRRARLRWIAGMRARGATEVHVHLLAEDEAGRRAVVSDLVDPSA